MPEKSPRTFKRLPYIALALIKTDVTAVPVEAYVVNLGYGGIAVYSNAELTGQLEITLFHEEEQARRAVTEILWGTVAWQKPVGTMTAYGIEFGNLNPDDHPITMSIVEKFVK
jgi:hypothetical protein